MGNEGVNEARAATHSREATLEAHWPSISTGSRKVERVSKKGRSGRRRECIGAAVAAALAVLLDATPTAGADTPTLSETAIREAIVGHTLDGHYGHGVTWTETYRQDGGLDYREAHVSATGRWSFRPGNVFCTFYDPGPAGTLPGGCWLVVRTSANCFEFYAADQAPIEPEDGSAPPLRWNAQGWRRDTPSTCNEKPSV